MSFCSRVTHTTYNIYLISWRFKWGKVSFYRSSEFLPHGHSNWTSNAQPTCTISPFLLYFIVVVSNDYKTMVPIRQVSIPLTYTVPMAVAMKITKRRVISLMQVVTPYLHRTYRGFARRYLLRGSTHARDIVRPSPVYFD